MSNHHTNNVQSNPNALNTNQSADTQVQRLLEIQSRQVDLSDQGLAPSYMVVLNHLWNQRYMAAVESASNFIEQDPEAEGTVRLYRAWIEGLANLEDQESLQALADHLFARGREEPELHQTYMALRGIIHLELDQLPMVRLLGRAIHGRFNNPYCLEFEQLCARRGICNGELAITHSTQNINDFFVWQTLAQDLTLDRSKDGLEGVLKHVARIFPGSPMMNEFNLHISLEFGHWAAAMGYAENLRSAFPQHRDYHFYAAYAAFKGNNLDEAIQIIDDLERPTLLVNADLTHLYGECLAARAERDDNDEDARHAIERLVRAAKMYRRIGLPIDKTMQMITTLEERVGPVVSVTHKTQFREPKSWLVVLSARRAAKMVSSSDEEISHLTRAMGAEPRPGDVVLFVSRTAHTAKKSSSHRRKWRLLSMYRVKSAPYFHPTEQWHNSLELIDRPEFPVPIDSEEINSDIDVRGKRNKLPRGHHARYGVFNLNDSAMDLMISAVKRRSQGIDHAKERRGETLSKKKLS